MTKDENYERSTAVEEAVQAFNDSSSLQGNFTRRGEGAPAYAGAAIPLPEPDPYYIAQEEAEMRERALHAAMHPALPPRPLPEVLTDAAAILKFLQTGASA